MDTPHPEKPEAFPSTKRTMIGQMVRAGVEGLAEARVHVMAVYARPLEIYFLGSSFRRMGDSTEAVHEFFNDRLPRPNFLSDWLEGERPLRFWLITAFKHHLMERERRERRWKRIPDVFRLHRRSGEGDPELLFHREVALRLVAEAYEQAEKACAEAGLADHWRVFTLHRLSDLPFDQIPPDLAPSPERAGVMARTAGNKFKNALRARVGWEGASESEVDAEIRALLEVIR